MELPMEAARRLIAAALSEDLGEAGDITAAATVPADLQAEARLIAKAEGIIAGLPFFAQVFSACAAETRVTFHVAEGSPVTPRDPVATIRGNARAILAAERTAINILAHLSGIATMTRRYVDSVAGTGAKILDTRKTTPGMRLLEKYAVAAGGGVNHRMGLHGAFLVKENHLALAGGIAPAVAAARAYAPEKAVQVEVVDLAQLREAIGVGVEMVLLDNMTPEQTVAAVRLARSLDPNVLLESSGGITLDNVRRYAETGVDRISVGALTHSVTALDLSLLIQF